MTDPLPSRQRLADAVRRFGDLPFGLLLLALPIWAHTTIPTVDGPYHTLAGWLLVHLHDPGRHYDRYLSLQVTPGNVGYDLFLGGLLRLGLGVRAAEKLGVTLVLVGEALALRRLLGIVQGPRSPWRWLAWVVPFACLYYFGILNYMLGLDLGLFAFGSAVAIAIDERAGRPVPRRRWLALGAQLLCTALGHGFAAAIAGLASGAVLVGTIPARRLPRALASLLFASLPTLALMAMTAMLASPHQKTPMAEVLHFDPARLGELPTSLFMTGYRKLTAANLLLALAALLCLVNAVRGRHASIGLGLAMAALLLVVTLIPDDIDAWEKLHVRFFPWAIACALAGADLSRSSPRARRAVAAGSICIALWVAFFVHVDNGRLAEMEREFESGIGKVSPVPARRLFIRPDPHHPTRRAGNTAANLYDWYMIEEGGVFVGVYAGRGEAQFIAHTDRWPELEPRSTPGRGQWLFDPRLAPASLAATGLSYDEVLGWDLAPAEIEAFRRMGYSLRWQGGGITRWASPARRLEVAVNAPGAHPELREADVFVDELPWPVAVAPLRATPAGLRASFDALPARAVRVVVGARGFDGQLIPVRQASADLGPGDTMIEE